MLNLSSLSSLLLSESGGRFITPCLSLHSQVFSSSVIVTYGMKTTREGKAEAVLLALAAACSPWQ